MASDKGTGRGGRAVWLALGILAVTWRFNTEKKFIPCEDSVWHRPPFVLLYQSLFPQGGL